MAEVFKTWSSDISILFGLRHLTIADGESDDHAYQLAKSETFKDYVDRQTQLIAKLISKAGNIRSLTWNSDICISKKIIETLVKHHPKATLKILSWHCVSSPQNHRFESVAEILGSCPALTVLRSRIIYDDRVYQRDVREKTFRRIVSTAPNLKHASIITILSSVSTSRSRAPFLAWAEGRYHEYYHHTHPNASLRTLTLDGYPISKNTLLDWGRFVDLSKLEEFKCTRGPVDVSYFEVAPALLTNLRHLSLNLAAHLFGGSHAADATVKFLQTCHPLESISIWSWSGTIPLEVILKHHGKTLTTLQLHERDHFYPRKVPTIEQIGQIREQCPKLEDLTIDMNRRGPALDVKAERLNMNKIREIAKFGTQLVKLQIYFDLGLKSFRSGEGAYDYDPYFDEDLDDDGESDDEDYARAIQRAKASENVVPPTTTEIKPFLAVLWKTVFGGRVTNTGRRELDVKFGEWERKFGGAWGQHASWIQGEEKNKTYWHVRPAERDDETDGQEAQIWGRCEVESEEEEEEDDKKVHDALNKIVFTTDEDADTEMDTAKADESADKDAAEDDTEDDGEDEVDTDDSEEEEDPDDDMLDWTERIPCIVTQVPRGKDGLAW